MDNEIEAIALARAPRIKREQILNLVPYIAAKQTDVSEIDVRALIKLAAALFKQECVAKEHPEAKIRALTTKFRDAGRRSAPWKPTSGRVPGRPQDGLDGNRINRWLLPDDHKFYATEIIATLVEVKYILQALSMLNAPDISEYNLSTAFTPWLLEHELLPGEYRDPVQLTQMDFDEFIEEPRSVQSGHIHPLDRGGVHHPENTFLMYFRSNQIQGNLTVEELLDFMRSVVSKHDEEHKKGSRLEQLIRKR